MYVATSKKLHLRTWLWLVLVVGIGSAFLAMYWVSTDAAVYLPAAKAIARGQMPYRDFVHNYTPLVPIVFSWIYKAWPSVPYFVIHLVQQIVVALSAIGCFVFAYKRMQTCKKTAFLLALLYYLAVLAQEGSGILLEPWMLLFIWPALYWAGAKKPIGAMGAGVLVALAFLVKQYGILYFIPMVLWWLMHKQWKHIAWACVGGILVALISIIICIYYDIPISSVWEQLLATNHQRMNTAGIFTWKTYVSGAKVFGWLLAGVGLLALRHKKIPWSYVLLFLVAVFLLLLPTVYRHYGHYFLLPLPFIMVAFIYLYKNRVPNTSLLWLLALPLFTVCLVKLWNNSNTFAIQQQNAIAVAGKIPVGSKVFVPVEWSYLTVLNDYDMPFAPTAGYAFIRLSIEKHQKSAPQGSVYVAVNPIPDGDSVLLQGGEKLYLYQKK